MSLNIGALEMVRTVGGKTLARCPACAESGRDRKGEHLFIGQDGRFGCVVFPGDAGHAHRQRIAQLAGSSEAQLPSFTVRQALPAGTPDVVFLQRDVLGHLGRQVESGEVGQASEEAVSKPLHFEAAIENCVPNVPIACPTPLPQGPLEADEGRLLAGMSDSARAQAMMLRELFGATILSEAQFDNRPSSAPPRPP